MVTEKEQKNNIILAFITLLSIIVIVAVVGFFMLRKGPEIIEGQAETNEYRVSSKIPGRILQFNVEEGQHVRKGDTLAILEAPEVIAKLNQVKALKDAAEAQNKKVNKGTRSETIQAAYEMWQKSIAGVTVTQKSYQRIYNLNKKGVVPAQKLDETTAQRDAAIATERAAKSQYDMAVRGAQIEDKEATEALVNQASSAIAEVEAYIKETYLIAQADGEVTEIFPQIGELVGTGAPIMNVAMMKDMWVTFNIREDLLNGVQIGDEFTAFIPAINKEEIKLKVTYIKDIGTYAAWKATKPTGQYDLKTFEIKAKPQNNISALRPGMSVIYLKN